MEIYLDLEKTLLNDKNQITSTSKKLLNEIAIANNITILSMSPLKEILKLTAWPKCRLVSVLENKVFYLNQIETSYLDNKIMNKIINDEAIYTAYTFNDDTIIFKYQERLKEFYPGNYFRLANQIDFSCSFLMLVINKKAFERIKLLLKDFYLNILFEDSHRIIANVTKTKSTKEAFICQYKKAPAIGAGDSLSDYDFIKHCEYQVAMQNASPELIKLCQYKTEYDNNQDGALKMITHLLKHQPS